MMDGLQDDRRDNRIDKWNQQDGTGTEPEERVAVADDNRVAETNGTAGAGYAAREVDVGTDGQPGDKAVSRTAKESSGTPGTDLEETAVNLSPLTVEDTGVLEVSQLQVKSRRSFREFCHDLATGRHWHRGVLVTIAILVILALIPLAGYGWEGFRLQRMASAGDVAGLTTFIRYNEGNRLKLPHLILAVDSLARLHSPSGNSFLESLIYSSAPLRLRREAARALVTNRVRVSDLARLYNYYKRNRVSTFKDTLISLLRIQPPQDLFRMVEQDLTSQLDQNNFDLSGVLAMVKELMPSRLDQIREVAGGYLRKRLGLLAETKNMDGIRGLILAIRGKGLLNESSCSDLLACIDSYQSNQGEISRLDSSINDLNKQIDSLKKQLTGLSYISLHGFIAGEIGDNIYAFALPGSSFLGLEFPSDNYALLQVVNPNFTGKGWFTVNARKLGQIPEKLQKKHGNLNQGWPFYQEVPQSEIDNYKQMEGQLSALMNQIQGITNQRQQLVAKNDQLFNQIREIIARNL